MIRDAESGQDGQSAGMQAEHIAAREDCGQRILELARPGDRIVIMGARDDTLTGFARDLFEHLG